MIRRRSPLKRTRLKPKPKKNPMPPGRRMEIFERDGWCCRNCFSIVSWEPGEVTSGHVHHIIKRSKHVDHSAANLILLCGFCHLPRVHHQGERSIWLWIDGDAATTRFLTERP